ncbi:unnamed protein product [Urochloa humidicola]
MRTLGVKDPRMGGREPEQQRRGAAARELAAAVAAALRLLAPRARSAPPHGETHPKAPTSALTFGTWTKVIDNALEHPFREDAHKMHMLPEKLAVLIFIRLEENDNLVLTPFEKNIDIYRQL